METKSSCPALAKRPRSKFLVGMAGFCAGLLLTQVHQFNIRHENSAAFELTLILAGWALTGLSLLYANRHHQQDELEILINRQALAFAFYAMLFGLVALEGLQSAGFVPRFAWKNSQLIMLLALLMITGFGMSKLRFR
jgi:signal transduction histidine kinase